MNDSDVDDILDFCLQNTEYYDYCKKQPSRELIINDMHMLPPNTRADSKYYVGFYDNKFLVAIMDLIYGFPDQETAFIGFFMTNKQIQGKQIGSAVIQEVGQYLKETGIKKIRLGIDKGNPQSTHFWLKNDFEVVNEVKQADGTILVAEKLL